ncbi:MAG TPA: hypothetical protein DEP28_00330 [Bacteroidetes bacterium]|nr:hypothetical protein [Ignavibacteria bacterium]HCA41678.1 hypothetical protein [Bacteroidota bacterium]HCN38592.1 hypothetical protein [Bacteroidota bacterium]
MKNIFLSVFLLILSIPENTFSQASGEPEKNNSISSINNDNFRVTNEYEMDVESFLGMFDGVISEELIYSIDENLPENLVVINYGVGDFDGDGKLDVAVSLRDETCTGKCYKVMLMINDEDMAYKTVGELYADWKDTPYDVGFNIEDGLCLITYREGEKWKSSYYRYNNSTGLRRVNMELTE